MHLADADSATMVQHLDNMRRSGCGSNRQVTILPTGQDCAEEIQRLLDESSNPRTISSR